MNLISVVPEEVPILQLLMGLFSPLGTRKWLLLSYYLVLCHSVYLFVSLIRL